MKISGWRAVLLIGLTASSAAVAGTISVVDFETVPVLATGPASLIGVPMQVIPVAGIATFTGGAVLGIASSLPGGSGATDPNVYATKSGGHTFETLKIVVNPSHPVNEISFSLFNELPFAQDYWVVAFDGGREVASEVLPSVQPTSQSGFALVDIVAPRISTLLIFSNNSLNYDFAIDTVKFTAIGDTALVPEPPPFLLAGSGLCVFALMLGRWRRRSA